MSKILLLQFDTDPNCAARRELLGKTKATVAEAEPRWPTFFDAVTAERPDIIVIAAATIPSHAIEAARYLGEGFNTRDIPVFLVDVQQSDLGRARSSAPQAHIIDRAALTQIAERAQSEQGIAKGT
jgi:hypothetical protein